MNKEIILKALQIGLDNTNEWYADIITCEYNQVKKSHLRQIWDVDRKQIEEAIQLVKGIKYAA